MAGIGPMEIVVVLIIALLVLGPKKLPDLGRSIGSGMREFKGALTGDTSDERAKERDERAEERPAREHA